MRLTRPFRRMWQLVPADTPRSSADCSRHTTYARPWRLLSAAANCLVTLGAVFFFSFVGGANPPEPGARVAWVRGWDDVRVCCSDTHKAGPDGISAVINARTHARGAAHRHQTRGKRRQHSTANIDLSTDQVLRTWLSNSIFHSRLAPGVVVVGEAPKRKNAGGFVFPPCPTVFPLQEPKSILLSLALLFGCNLPFSEK